MHRNFLQAKTFTALVLLLVFNTDDAGCQPDTNHAVYWIRYQNQVFFKPHVWWSNEVDNRRFISPDAQQQFILHSRVHYRIKHWDFGGGLTFSWAYTQDPEEPVTKPVMEVRPVVEASYEIPARGFKLQQRLRLDNRFFEADKNVSILEKSVYVARFRYRLQALVPLKKNDGDEPVVSLRLADEIMLNDGANTFDQNRVYATVEFILSEKLSVESGYIHIYQQSLGGDLFTRHVLRFSVTHKLALY